MVLLSLSLPCAHTRMHTYTQTALHEGTNTLALKHGKLEGQVEVLINIHQNLMLVFPGILSSNITVTF